MTYRQHQQPSGHREGGAAWDWQCKDVTLGNLTAADRHGGERIPTARRHINDEAEEPAE